MLTPDYSEGRVYRMSSDLRGTHSLGEQVIAGNDSDR